MKRTIFTFAGRALALPAILIFLIILLWTSCCAAEPVTVCILDSGCSDEHNEGESFLGDSDDLTDSIGHGTDICSLVRSGAPEAKVVMLKCFESQDTVNEEAIISALYAAVDTYHADIINMSWTLTEESDALHEAILHAHEQGAILVACTGNLSLSTGLGIVAYPAAWDEVIGVAGVNLNEEGEPQTSLWYLYGEAVDFCARSDCGDEKGSSYSTARVTGLIAAALSNGMEPSQILEYLTAEAQDMGEPGYDERYGWGYLETEF
ncbi:MAG: S8/S53 family peptidase [Candidatus Choladocola sp.]|nr:S8/S53 family peptidase [Candidatus Choladocola sp.]